VSFDRLGGCCEAAAGQYTATDISLRGLDVEDDFDTRPRCRRPRKKSSVFLWVGVPVVIALGVVGAMFAAAKSETQKEALESQDQMKAEQDFRAAVVRFVAESRRVVRIMRNSPTVGLFDDTFAVVQNIGLGKAYPAGRASSDCQIDANRVKNVLFMFFSARKKLLDNENADLGPLATAIELQLDELDRK
jgi:hypothetical protein